MKYLFAVLVFLIFSFGCDAPADNDPKMVKGWLDPNPEVDMSHYEVYWWQGNTEAEFNPGLLTQIETVPHSFVADSIGTDSFQVVLDYVVFGAVAVDSSGEKSNMSYTRIYSYAEFFAPSDPDSLRIED